MGWTSSFKRRSARAKTFFNFPRLTLTAYHCYHKIEGAARGKNDLILPPPCKSVQNESLGYSILHGDRNIVKSVSHRLPTFSQPFMFL